MTVLLILAGVAFTTFMLYLMVKPLVVSREDAVRVDHLAEQFREIELLMARRGVLLSSLRELEFERETDKIAQEDYERFRARFEREAVMIMKRLDDLHGGRGWESRIDEELEQRLGRPPHIVTMKANAAAESDEQDGDAADSSTEDATESQPASTDEALAGDPSSEEADEDSVDDEESVAPEDEPSDIEEEDSDEETLDDEASGGDEAPEAEAAEAEPESIAKSDEDLACAECGSELTPDDKFCSQCGTPTQFAEAAPKEASA